MAKALLEAFAEVLTDAFTTLLPAAAWLLAWRVPWPDDLPDARVLTAADALTSVLAIAALLLGRYFGWVWTDPAMGLVGSVVILRWSWGLMRDTARVLLDATSEADHIRSEVREALAGDGTLTDLHVWQVGPSHFAAIVALRSHTLQSADAVKAKLAHVHELSHLTVEIQRA